MQRFILVIMLLSIFSCQSEEELPTVKELDLKQYAGTWYEIARLPNSFEKGLDCVSATYSLREDGKVGVMNRGRKTDDTSVWKDIEGTARIPNKEEPGRLKVTFFWPFAGDYYIINVASDYSFALVGSPDRKFLWILGRERILAESTSESLLEQAKKLGFDTSKVIRVKQDCE